VEDKRDEDQSHEEAGEEELAGAGFIGFEK
jgi:hypothetical protein